MAEIWNPAYFVILPTPQGPVFLHPSIWSRLDTTHLKWFNFSVFLLFCDGLRVVLYKKHKELLPTFWSIFINLTSSSRFFTFSYNSVFIFVVFFVRSVFRRSRHNRNVLISFISRSHIPAVDFKRWFIRVSWFEFLLSCLCNWTSSATSASSCPFPETFWSPLDSSVVLSSAVSSRKELKLSWKA